MLEQIIGCGFMENHSARIFRPNQINLLQDGVKAARHAHNVKTTARFGFLHPVLDMFIWGKSQP